MIIQSLELTAQTLKLNKTLLNSKNEYSEKENFIIKITTQNHIGYGEVSPLNGFSKETSQQINWNFQSFIQSVKLHSQYSLKELLNLVEIHCHDTPSLHFGLDTALYDLKCKKERKSISQFLNYNSKTHVNFSSLYNQKLIRNNNCNTIKYKIGINSITDDVITLSSLTKKNKNIKFRLDANRCYTVSDFEKLLIKFKQFNIEYYEDPIADLTLSLLQRLKKHDINIAIDESLYNGDDYKLWIKNNLIDYVILKPSIYGSYKKNLKLLSLCNKYHTQCIISSALEGPIGNMATIHFAAILNSNNTHGINIHNFYNQFLFKPIYNAYENNININNVIGLGIK